MSGPDLSWHPEPELIDVREPATSRGPLEALGTLPEQRRKLAPCPSERSRFGRYVSQSGCDANQSGIGRDDGVVAGVEQHTMGTRRIQMRKQPQRAAGG